MFEGFVVLISDCCPGWCLAALTANRKRTRTMRNSFNTPKLAHRTELAIGSNSWSKDHIDDFSLYFFFFLFC